MDPLFNIDMHLNRTDLSDLRTLLYFLNILLNSLVHTQENNPVLHMMLGHNFKNITKQNIYNKFIVLNKTSDKCDNVFVSEILTQLQNIKAVIMERPILGNKKKNISQHLKCFL